MNVFTHQLLKVYFFFNFKIIGFYHNNSFAYEIHFNDNWINIMPIKTSSVNLNNPKLTQYHVRII